MLEIYEIVWRNKDVTGYLEYNTKTDKFQAYLKDRENPNPRGLFGILKISDVVEDGRVRLYISDCVVPKTRENIDDHINAIKTNILNLRNINDSWHVFFNKEYVADNE